MSATPGSPSSSLNSLLSSIHVRLYLYALSSLPTSSLRAATASPATLSPLLCPLAFACAKSRCIATEPCHSAVCALLHSLPSSLLVGPPSVCASLASSMLCTLSAPGLLPSHATLSRHLLALSGPPVSRAHVISTLAWEPGGMADLGLSLISFNFLTSGPVAYAPFSLSGSRPRSSAPLTWLMCVVAWLPRVLGCRSFLGFPLPGNHVQPLASPLPPAGAVLRACLLSASSRHASSTVRSTSLSLPPSRRLSSAPRCAPCHLSMAPSAAPCACCTASITIATIAFLSFLPPCRPKSGTHPANTSSRRRHRCSLSAASSPACRRILASCITFLNSLLHCTPSLPFIGTAFSILHSASTNAALVLLFSGRPAHPVRMCCSVASGAPVLYNLVSGLRMPAALLSLSVVVCATLGPSSLACLPLASYCIFIPFSPSPMYSQVSLSPSLG